MTAEADLWMRRPLAADLLAYAAADVASLLPLATRLEQNLQVGVGLYARVRVQSLRVSEASILDRESRKATSPRCCLIADFSYAGQLVQLRGAAQWQSTQYGVKDATGHMLRVKHRLFCFGSEATETTPVVANACRE